VQFDDPEKRGGGVSVYLRNLIGQLVKQNQDVYFLCSGLSYNLFKSDTYIRRTKNIFGNNCRTFEIVNSRVMSPGHFSFHTIKDTIENREMTEVFYEFLKENGPFDVIHFHNLEGIPLNFLKLTREFPSTKAYLTLHNYFPFCPQVNLWHREKQNCRNYLDGARCVNCLTYEPPYQAAIRAHQLAFMLKSLGFGPETRFFNFVFRHVNRLKRVYRWIYSKTHPPATVNNLPDHNKKIVIEGLKSAKVYAERRRFYVSVLNEFCHRIIAVSQRTAALAKDFNVQGSKLSVLYIGTEQAEHIKLKRKPPEKGEVISFLYMGYMRRDKGFYFLLEVLESLPRESTSKIRIVIAAPITDDYVVERLKGLADKYYEIIVHDGYTHSNLPGILKGVHVGIIPVLWEDNLPQVAVEMVSNGIPIITSDLGGSAELSQCKKFVFKAGSKERIEQVINGIVDDPSSLKSYWDETLTLQTMSMHIDELFKLYRAGGRKISEAADSDNRLCENKYPFNVSLSIRRGTGK
jgi:glycosyltransferase involved in cell wall biosynthesis